MARYHMEDATVVDTKNAKQSWEEKTDWNGNNHFSRATGSQWMHQTLYKSRRGRYYIVYTNQWQGSQPHAEWISPQEATRWLLLMEQVLPEDLEQYVDEVSE